MSDYILLTQQAWKMQLEAAAWAGASLEREAVVDWLRADAELQVLEHNVYLEDTTAHRYAREVERGDHVQPTDSPLTELDIMEAKQRHPSRREL